MVDPGVKEEREEKKSCIQCGKELKGFNEIKIGGQTFKVCNKQCAKLLAEQIKEERKDKLDKSRIDLKMNQRELAFKMAQIATGVLEKNESKLYNVVSFPKDDLKPKHVLENEIDMIKFHLIQKEKEIKNMEDLEKEDVKPT